MQTILNRPDDEAARLIYADWLDEHGDSDRAEFIRVQVALATMDQADDRWPHFYRRQQWLLLQHRTQWLEDVPAWCRSGAVFRQGFVDEVQCHVSDFTVRGYEVPRRVPVRRLVISEPPDNFIKFLRLPALKSIESLALDRTWTASTALPTLADCPPLPNLRQLSFKAHRPQPDFLLRLTESPLWDHLEGIALSPFDIGDAESQGLAARGGPSRLRTLSLTDSAISYFAPIARFLTSPLLGSLTELDLSNNVTDDPDRAILMYQQLPPVRVLSLAGNVLPNECSWLVRNNGLSERLQRLDLTGCSLPAPVTEALSDSDCPHLKWLSLARINPDNDAPPLQRWELTGIPSLARGQLDNQALQRLFAGSLVKQLTYFDLAHIHLTADIIDSTTQLSNLRHLHFVDTNMNTVTLYKLANTSIERLHVLNLRQNPLGPQGGAILANWPALQHVAVLQLGSTGLRDEGVSALASSPYVGQVTELDLRYCRITDAGAMALAESPVLQQLTRLELEGNNIDTRAATALLRRFGSAVRLGSRTL